MRTTETKMKEEIQRYMNHGFSLEVSVSQVKALYLHRHDSSVERAAKEIS